MPRQVAGVSLGVARPDRIHAYQGSSGEKLAAPTIMFVSLPLRARVPPTIINTRMSGSNTQFAVNTHKPRSTPINRINNGIAALADPVGKAISTLISTGVWMLGRTHP